MKNLVYLLIFCLIISCNNNKNKISQGNNKSVRPYIISYEDKKLKLYLDSLNENNIKTVPPLKAFYYESNLIIDKNNNLYFYQRNRIAVGCGTGMENDTLPEFLNLQPKDLIKIPKESIGKIVYENVMTKEKNRKILIIASQIDTIKNRKILNFLNDLKVPTYIIRRTTQEEDIVLHYKITNQFYYSNEIKWDKNRIKLRN